MWVPNCSRQFSINLKLPQAWRGRLLVLDWLNQWYSNISDYNVNFWTLIGHGKSQLSNIWLLLVSRVISFVLQMTKRVDPNQRECPRGVKLSNEVWFGLMAGQWGERNWQTKSKVSARQMDSALIRGYIAYFTFLGWSDYH